MLKDNHLHSDQPSVAHVAVGNSIKADEIDDKPVADLFRLRSVS